MERESSGNVIVQSTSWVNAISASRVPRDDLLYAVVIQVLAEGWRGALHSNILLLVRPHRQFSEWE